MNNGVNNSTQNDSNNSLQPMAGVKIAPPSSEPVNASNSSTAASALGRNVSGSQLSSTPTPNTATTTPVITSSTPANNNITGNNPVNTTQGAQPVIVSNQTVTNTGNTTPPIIPPPVNQNTAPIIDGGENNTKKAKRKLNLTPILIFVILGLVIYIFISSEEQKTKINNILYNCTPVTSSKETIKLDLDSTLVKDLYSRVATNMREDLANPTFDDKMRLYLAYRQILETDKYDSNCNLFNQTAIEPYICNNDNGFVPKAFKAEAMELAIKKMYGEKTSLGLANIQLGSTCVGGYQYIQERGEYVQGYCLEQPAVLYKVDKKLKEATSTKNTIVLVEEVKYHQSQQNPVPETLKNGLYIYTFRLDMNYNYVFVNKEYKEKY